MKSILVLLLSGVASMSYGAEGCSAFRATLNGINPSVTVVQYGHELEGLAIPYVSNEGVVNDTAYLESVCISRQNKSYSNSHLNLKRVSRRARICGVTVFKCNIVSNIDGSKRRERSRSLNRPKAEVMVSMVSENPPSESSEDYPGIVSENPPYFEIIDGVAVDQNGSVN